MPLSFGLNLGASTDGSVEDLSITGSCTSVRTTVREYTQPEYYMPRTMARFIKSFKTEMKLMGLKPIMFVHGYGFRTTQRCGFSSRMTSGLTLLKCHFEYPLKPDVPSPTTSRDIALV